jgi:hypothetical protein
MATTNGDTTAIALDASSTTTAMVLDTSFATMVEDHNARRELAQRLERLCEQTLTRDVVVLLLLLF